MKPTDLEDAVLSLLGEGNLEADEVTETGTPDWGSVEKLALEKIRTQGRVASPVRVPVIHFAPRRSASQLPWNTLASRA